jgi:hypothetical protein
VERKEGGGKWAAGRKTGKGGRWAGPRGEKLDRFVSFFFFFPFLFFNTHQTKAKETKTKATLTHIYLI